VFTSGWKELIDHYAGFGRSIPKQHCTDISLRGERLASKPDWLQALTTRPPDLARRRESE
jgi:hypothetical protein